MRPVNSCWLRRSLRKTSFYFFFRFSSLINKYPGASPNFRYQFFISFTCVALPLIRNRNVYYHSIHGIPNWISKMSENLHNFKCFNCFETKQKKVSFKKYLSVRHLCMECDYLPVKLSIILQKWQKPNILLFFVLIVEITFTSIMDEFFVSGYTYPMLTDAVPVLWNC